METRAGYVLVGGRSSRMGSDKGLLPYRGRTLVEFVAAAVEEAVGRPALVGSGALYGHLGYPVRPDIYPEKGPLPAILTVLQYPGADWNLIVACDMPGLTGPFLRKLVDAAVDSDADALVPVSPSGLEPLCAVYHRRALAGLYRAFERGVRKMATALEEIRVTRLPMPELDHFKNVNTPEDWSQYAG